MCHEGFSVKRPPRIGSRYRRVASIASARSAPFHLVGWVVRIRARAEFEGIHVVDSLSVPWAREFRLGETCDYLGFGCQPHELHPKVYRCRIRSAIPGCLKASRREHLTFEAISARQPISDAFLAARARSQSRRSSLRSEKTSVGNGSRASGPSGPSPLRILARFSLVLAATFASLFEEMWATVVPVLLDPVEREH